MFRCGTAPDVILGTAFSQVFDGRMDKDVLPESEFPSFVPVVHGLVKSA